MTGKVMTFSDVENYLKDKGLQRQTDYTLSADIETVELNIGSCYFCSVGRYDKTSFEVFELHHGAQVSEDGKDYLTDGELWQYKVYKSLKRALDFALKCKTGGKLPDKALKIW